MWRPWEMDDVPISCDVSNTITSPIGRGKKLKLNPWRYSPEESRPTEAVAARWQYRGLCSYQSAYRSILISVSLLIQVATQLSSEGGWTPFQTLYFQKNF